MFLSLSIYAAGICDLTKLCKVCKEHFAIEATYQLILLFTNFQEREITVFFNEYALNQGSYFNVILEDLSKIKKYIYTSLMNRWVLISLFNANVSFFFFELLLTVSECNIYFFHHFRGIFREIKHKKVSLRNSVSFCFIVSVSLLITVYKCYFFNILKVSCVVKFQTNRVNTKLCFFFNFLFLSVFLWQYANVICF